MDNGEQILKICIMQKYVPLHEISFIFSSCMSLAIISKRDEIWKELAFNCMPSGFWEIASQRSCVYSHPLPSWNEELKRIIVFQTTLYKSTGVKWSMNDFITYWTSLEKNNNSLIKKN